MSAYKPVARPGYPDHHPEPGDGRAGLLCATAAYASSERCAHLPKPASIPLPQVNPVLPTASSLKTWGGCSSAVRRLGRREGRSWTGGQRKGRGSGERGPLRAWVSRPSASNGGWWRCSGSRGSDHPGAACDRITGQYPARGMRDRSRVSSSRGTRALAPPVRAVRRTSRPARTPPGAIRPRLPPRARPARRAPPMRLRASEL